jgi:hypothetical protein
MPTPDLGFASALQHDERWGPPGIAFKDFLDEYFAVLPRVVVPGGGETYTTASIVDNFPRRSAADFTPVGVPAVQGAPSIEATLWRLYRITALTAVDIVLRRANQHPNDLLTEDARFKWTCLVQVAAEAIANGDPARNQWLGFDNDAFPKTIIESGGTSPQDLKNTLKRMDDATRTHELGRRASCYVTTARGRRNCEAAQELQGHCVQYVVTQGVVNPVPTYRGRPIYVAYGLYDNVELQTAPIYAIDLSQTFFLATSGTTENWCVGEEPMAYQDSNNVGLLQYMHGSLVAVSNCAYVKSAVTTTLSA